MPKAVGIGGLFFGRRTRLAWPNGIKSISVLTTCTSRYGGRRRG